MLRLAGRQFKLTAPTELYALNHQLLRYYFVSNVLHPIDRLAVHRFLDRGADNGVALLLIPGKAIGEYFHLAPSILRFHENR